MNENQRLRTKSIHFFIQSKPHEVFTKLSELSARKKPRDLSIQKNYPHSTTEP